MRYWFLWLFAPKAFYGKVTRKAYVAYMIRQMKNAENYMVGVEADDFAESCFVAAKTFVEDIK